MITVGPKVVLLAGEKVVSRGCGLGASTPADECVEDEATGDIACTCLTERCNAGTLSARTMPAAVAAAVMLALATVARHP